MHGLYLYGSDGVKYIRNKSVGCTFESSTYLRPLKCYTSPICLAIRVRIRTVCSLLIDAECLTFDRNHVLLVDRPLAETLSLVLSHETSL